MSLSIQILFSLQLQCVVTAVSVQSSLDFFLAECVRVISFFCRNIFTVDLKIKSESFLADAVCIVSLLLRKLLQARKILVMCCSYSNVLSSG